MSDPTATNETASRYRPNTIQLQSALIDELAATFATHPPDPDRFHGNDKIGDRYLILYPQTHVWHHHLPDAWNGERHRMALGRNGLLYVCDGDQWNVISDGLQRHLAQPPHTFGFAQMDSEMIADHVIETIRAWMAVNFELADQEAAREEIRLALDKLNSPIGMVGTANMIRRATTEMERSHTHAREFLASTPQTAVRVGALDEMVKGAAQSLHLATNLLSAANAVCRVKLTPFEEPENPTEERP